MKTVTVVDVAVELVFGAAAGCALFLCLMSRGPEAYPVDPFVAVGIGGGLLQATFDVLRGRGWPYALWCAFSFCAGVFFGGYLTMIGAVLYRLLS